MGDKKISALTTIPAVDRAADLLYIADTSGSTSNKVTPNTLLGFSGGNPVSTSDTQTLTAKTLTSPAISSPTLSGTIAGTYTIDGTPTFPSSVVQLTSTQTLTNKTLTSPTINSPTITNPTLTVDTVSEFTSANGVNIDGLLIKDGLLPAGNIQPLNLQSGTGSSWAWQTWTPTTTSMTLGNGTITAKYRQIGKTVTGILIFTLGSTSAVSSNPTFTLPVTATSDHSAGTTPGIIIGMGWALDAGTIGYVTTIRSISTTAMQLEVLNSAATRLSMEAISSVSPFTWATNDRLGGTFNYEAA